MWNEPSEEELRELPSINTNANTPWKEIIIHQHYILDACDWFMAEYDPQGKIFFGFAILNDDLVNAEWGYVSFEELRDVNVRGIEVDRDLHWRSRPASEVERIVEAYRHQGRRR